MANEHSSDAKNQKFIIRPETNTDNNPIKGGEHRFTINDTGTGTPVGIPDKAIEVVKAYTPADAEFDAFMCQTLEVQVHDAGSEDEPQFAEITVNGDHVVARRGDITFMKRYHVAVLAQAKTARIRQDKKLHADGSMTYEECSVLKMTYPFSVIEDPAGRRGSAWLRPLMASPA